MNRLKKRLYRNLLMTSLGVTKMISKADYAIPSKWYTFYDSLRVSSEMAHAKLAMVDQEVQEEFLEKEEMIERRLGRKKFYSQEEINELQKKIDQIKLKP